MKKSWREYWHRKGQILWEHSRLREKGKLEENLWHKLSEKALHKILLMKRDIRRHFRAKKMISSFNNGLRRQGKLPLRWQDKAYDLCINALRRLGFHIEEKQYPEPY